MFGQAAIGKHVLLPELEYSRALAGEMRKQRRNLKRLIRAEELMKFARYVWTVIGDHENAGCMGNILAYQGGRGKIKRCISYHTTHAAGRDGAAPLMRGVMTQLSGASNYANRQF